MPDDFCSECMEFDGGYEETTYHLCEDNECDCHAVEFSDTSPLFDRDAEDWE